jgi:peptidoglycan hydrolase CwlO-like protein
MDREHASIEREIKRSEIESKLKELFDKKLELQGRIDDLRSQMETEERVISSVESEEAELRRELADLSQ